MTGPKTLRSLGIGLIGATALLSASTQAYAADKGRPVTIRVVDSMGMPVSNAKVRVPRTEGMTEVNRNGEWTETMLYTIEGDEFVFKKNEWIVFNVSAPEFHARSVKYRIRGRMNYVEVALREMPDALEEVEDDSELLIKWFNRTELEDGPAPAPEPPAEPENNNR